MSTQISRDTPLLQAWARLLRGHATLTRSLSADLERAHGLTINDYEVLLFLARAPGRRMRRVDLAARVLLTPSGVTRLLEGLERSGYVERVACREDARVSYAQLTDSGARKLHAAARSHLAAIEDAFRARYSADELGQLAELLGRLPGAEDADCAPE